jgi:hypothetical protein
MWHVYFFLPVLVFVVSSPPQLNFFPRSATTRWECSIVGILITHGSVMVAGVSGSSGEWNNPTGRGVGAMQADVCG